jgi:hypothetical protein
LLPPSTQNFNGVSRATLLGLGSADNRHAHLKDNHG